MLRQHLMALWIVVTIPAQAPPYPCTVVGYNGDGDPVSCCAVENHDYSSCLMRAGFDLADAQDVDAQSTNNHRSASPTH
jgi:hypothetical protein